MYKDVLRSIEGIEIYPVISFLIFFGFFLGLILFVVKQDKSFISKMKNLPMESDGDDDTAKRN
jgi:hypothetical protein